jgi:dienelactone hydrolase
MKHWYDLSATLLTCALLTLASSTGVAAVKGEEVDYSDGNIHMKGYIAYDDSIEGKRPGVLVVHEWWGHNTYTRKRADMLAELGYTALAVDMYGDGKQAAHPDDAGKFAKEASANMETMKSRFMAAMDLLKQQETVNPDKIAAIGYCFGGGVVLNMARSGADLKGVASFHGSLGTSAPAQPGQVKARVLVMHGADDKFIPPDVVKAFKDEMDSAGVDYKFIAYPGALHSFTNPDADKFAEQFGMPVKYDPAADEQSWNELKTFLQAVFAD